jgi:hypothetical protein
MEVEVTGSETDVDSESEDPESLEDDEEFSLVT